MSDMDIVYTEDMIGIEFTNIDLELEAITQQYIDELISKATEYKAKKTNY